MYALYINPALGDELGVSGCLCMCFWHVDVHLHFSDNSLLFQVVVWQVCGHNHEQLARYVLSPRLCLPTKDYQGFYDRLIRIDLSHRECVITLGYWMLLTCVRWYSYDGVMRNYFHCSLWARWRQFIVCSGADIGVEVRESAMWRIKMIRFAKLDRAC